MAAKKRDIKKVDITAVPEVVEFENAKAELQGFKEMHADVFAEYAEYVERYNTTLEAAERACREKEASCGDFDLYQYTTKYDAEALYNAVGRDEFMKLGGKIDTVAKYSVEKARIEAAIAQGLVTPAVAAVVRKEVPSYHVPDKVVLA
jgi:hypothetical protein